MPIRFGAFTLDDRARQLFRGAEEIHLSPKAFDLLALLVRDRPAAKSKDDLHRELWPDTFVSDGNVAVLVAEIRAALLDDARHPSFIRTVHRHGYAFCGTAEAFHPPAARIAFAASLTWGGRHMPLAPGENIVGRDPSAHICIEAAGVSRRHARILLSAGDATIEDLGSKNGTFVNGERVTGRTRIADGAELRIGLVPITFRRMANTGSTQTVDYKPDGIG